MTDADENTSTGMLTRHSRASKIALPIFGLGGHVQLPGIDEELPAVIVATQPTSSLPAWKGQRWTVRLIAPMPALRVHSRGGSSAARQESLAFGASTVGRWFAIGDVILGRDDYTRMHALPAPFSHQDDWLLPVGTVLNVGIAGPLFGHAGGALQAERLSGPPAQHLRMEGFWSNAVGTA